MRINTMRNSHLFAFAESLGFQVRIKPLQAHDGLLYGNRIGLREGLDREYMNYILAHELAHAYLHEGDTIHSPLHAEYERQADKGAALILDLLRFMENRKEKSDAEKR